MKKCVLFSLLWTLLLFVVTGCGGVQQVPGQSEREGNAGALLQEQARQGGGEEQIVRAGETEGAGEKDTPEGGAPGFPLILTDASGVEITLEKAPERIVSILPSHTESAFALRLGEKMVGVSDWDNYPEEVKDIAKVGGLEPNTERIVSLEPDLVLAGASANEHAIGPLRDLGLTVLVLPEAHTFDGIYETLRMLGRATGTLPEAEVVIEEMEKKQRAVTEKVTGIPEEEKPLVWVEVSPDLVTAGAGTFINDIIHLAGGINVAAGETGWPQISEEQVIAWAPEVILTTYGYYVENPSEQVYARTAWFELPAVKEKRVYDVNNDILTRPGPRLVDGLAEVAHYLHPELF